MRKLFLVCAVAVVMLALASPAKADSVLVLNDANGCGGSNCFGNVLTFTIKSLGGGSYKVSLAIDTTGNTNPGSAIAGVTFKFGDMSSATLTAAPGGIAGWLVTNATLSANGCESGNQSPACTFDSAFIGTLNSPFATVGLASLPHAGTYTWEWDVQASGAVGVTAVRALFGKMNGETVTVIDSSIAPTKGSCPSPYVKVGGNCVISHTETHYSYKQTGLISASGTPTTQVPEPASAVLLGLGLIGLAGLRRFRS